MERHLNLIKTEFKELEKRVLPRFPFTYLTFKNEGESQADQKVFEVKDISFTGMQLSLKDGDHKYIPGADISGIIHWRGATLDTKGKVKWVKGHSLGVEFIEDENMSTEVKNFLSIDNIVAGMKPIHKSGLELETPANLKYWLRADGPFEIFIWCHPGGELSRFQIILMENFVEWEDGVGLKSGRVLTQRDLDTPLSLEDEFVFSMDEGVDMEKIRFTLDIIERLSEDHLSATAKDFVKRKLGA